MDKKNKHKNVTLKSLLLFFCLRNIQIKQWLKVVTVFTTSEIQTAVIWVLLALRD
jgi:hypothetical protein